MLNFKIFEIEKCSLGNVSKQLYGIKNLKYVFDNPNCHFFKNLDYISEFLYFILPILVLVKYTINCLKKVNG